MPIQFSKNPIVKVLAVTALVAMQPLTANALGFRIYDDMGELRSLGFDFKVVPHGDDLVSVTITAPKDFEVNKEDKALGSKPYRWMSLIEVPGPTKLPAAPHSSFVLATAKNEKGLHEANITAFRSRSEKLFISFMFVEEAPGSWGIVVFVPLSSILKEAKASP